MTNSLICSSNRNFWLSVCFLAIFWFGNKNLQSFGVFSEAPDLGQKGKEILINSFLYSNFNYGPLIWHLKTRKGVNKIEKVQERSLKFILNDYDKTYFQLLDISKKPSMEVKRLRILITEIFKTLHDSNPVFMKDIFHYCQNKSHKKHNLHVHSRNTSRYGSSLRVLGAHIWNSLLENIKCKDSVYELKNFLKGWYGCKCYLCLV